MDLLDGLSGLTAQIQVEQNRENTPIGTFVGGTLGFLIPMSSSSVRDGLVSKLRGTELEFDAGLRAFIRETNIPVSSRDSMNIDGVTNEERLQVKQRVERAIAENVIDVNTEHGREVARMVSYINEDGSINSSFYFDEYDRKIQKLTQELYAEFPDKFPKDLVVTSSMTMEERAQFQEKFRQHFDYYADWDQFWQDPNNRFNSTIVDLHHTTRNSSNGSVWIPSSATGIGDDFDNLFNDLMDADISTSHSNMKLVGNQHEMSRLYAHTDLHNSLLPHNTHSLEQEMHMRELKSYLEKHLDEGGRIRDFTSFHDELSKRLSDYGSKSRSVGRSAIGKKTLLQPTRRAGAFAKVAGGTVLGALAGAGIDYALADNQDYTPDIQVNTNINVEDVFSSALLDNMRQYHSMGTAGAEQMLLSAQTLLDQGYVLEDEIFGSALAYMTEHNCTFSDYAKSDSAHPQVKQVFETLQTTLRTLFEHEEAKALFKEFNLDMNNEELALVVASNMLDGSFYDLLQDVAQQQKDMEQNHESTQNDEYFLSQYGERYVEQEGVTSSLVKDNHSKTV